VEPEVSLLRDVSIALGIAFAGGWAATRLRLSSIVGYIVAGIVISPFTPGFVGDVDRLRLIADIGIVLLLFGIGVQFSLGDLARPGARLIAAP
jgi:CPA2 family monovalent cation:H+ antiporter-2